MIWILSQLKTQKKSIPFMWFTMIMMEISTNKLFFIEKIAKPAESVNGQDERAAPAVDILARLC